MVLEPSGSHVVLATFRVRDDDGAIVIARRQPAQVAAAPDRRRMRSGWPGASPRCGTGSASTERHRLSASLGDDRVWTVRFYDRRRRDRRGARSHDRGCAVTEVRTGPAGRLDAGARAARRRTAGWSTAGGCSARSAPAVRRRPDGLAAAGLAAHARPAGAGLVRRLAALVQPRRHLRGHAAGLPAAALPGGRGWSGIGFGSAARAASPIGPTHMLVLVALHLRADRLPAGPEQPELEHPRRRLRQRGGRRPADRRPGALRHDARRRHGEPCGGYRSGGDPVGYVQRDHGPLRVAGLDRRHLRPDRLRGLRPVRRDLRLERPVGRPAGGARRRVGLRPRRHPRPVRRGLAAGVAHGWACCWRSAGRPTRSRSTRST